jgi:DNA transposition AAA+ family ATPase
METVDRIKPFKEELRLALEAYRSRHELTLTELARELATNTTQISKYLNRKPEGDIPRIESLIEDVLKNENRRKESRDRLFSTSISQALSGTCETIWETNDMGLIFGPAGLGKSCAIELYAAANPTAIPIVATAWRCSGNAIESLICSAVSMRGWAGNTNRGEYLSRKLAGSNRIILVDNAHKLRLSALSWLFDFHDATECPVALIGNPSVLDVIRMNDQWFSRIGIKRELRVNPKQVRAVSDQIVTQLIPDAPEDLRELCVQVGEHQGYFRAVRKQLLTARKIRENSKETPSWADAFKSAHTQLIRDYAVA